MQWVSPSSAAHRLVVLDNQVESRLIKAQAAIPRHFSGVNKALLVGLSLDRLSSSADK